MKEININKKIDEKEIELLVQEIKKGKLFIFPTSTLYGVGCSAFNEDSIKKIYDIKKRPYTKPLIVLASNLEMVRKITKDINAIEESLIKEFWPGNLTLILRKNEIIPDIVTNKKDYVGIRIDENTFIRNIIEKSNVPLVAPSANISGEDSIDDFKNLNIKLKQEVDYCINLGKIKNGLCSTIVKVENGKVKILREGKIKAYELTKKGFEVIK